MAKNEAPVADATAATEAAPAADNRFIKVSIPEGHPSGLAAGEHKRIDVIRAMADTGNFTRGEIAAELTKLQGVKVAYQIVFQATKGHPKIKAAQKAEAAAPVEEAPAAE